MFSYLTANDIANTVRLTRTLFPGTVVIAEGYTDIRVYKRFFSETACQLVPSYGKQNAMDATLILDGEYFVGLLTIVDADFDNLESINPVSPNILYSDTHDLETMILCSSALDNVLSELLSTQSSKSMPAPILDLAFKATLPLGYFRWLSSSHKENLGLRFKGIAFNHFISTPTFVTNVDLMIDEVIANTGSHSFNFSVIKAKLLTLLLVPQDKWQVCSGHDLVEVIFLALKNHWGNHRAQALTLDLFDAMLRLTYNDSDFKTRYLYRQIQNWEINNFPFQVLN